MRKTLSFLVIAASMALTDLKAQEAEMGVFNHLAAGVSVGTTGLSFNLASPVTDYLAVTAAVDWMPDFRRTDDIQYYLYQDLTQYGLGKWESGTHTLNMKGGVGRVQGAFVLNVYPFRNADFYLAAGAYFGGGKILDMNGSSQDLESDINAVRGLYDRVAAYYQSADKQMPGELGIQFSGKYKLESDNCSDAVLKVLGIQKKYADTLDDLNKLKCYPVLKLRLAGRIF